MENLNRTIRMAIVQAAVCDPPPPWKPFRRGSSRVDDLTGWFQSIYTREQLLKKACDIAGIDQAAL